jgi:hypothetical protein
MYPQHQLQGEMKITRNIKHLCKQKEKSSLLKVQIEKIMMIKVNLKVEENQ